MPIKRAIQGSCLCDAVRFEIRSDPNVYRYCFCSLCRKSRGTIHSANLVVDPNDFEWQNGEDFITRFDLPSSRFGNCFCRNCGSPVPRLTLSETAMIVPAGCLDEARGISPHHVVFAESRVTWLPDAASLPQHDRFAQ